MSGFVRDVLRFVSPARSDICTLAWPGGCVSAEETIAYIALQKPIEMGSAQTDPNEMSVRFGSILLKSPVAHERALATLKSGSLRRRSCVGFYVVTPKLSDFLAAEQQLSQKPVFSTESADSGLSRHAEIGQKTSIVDRRPPTPQQKET